MKDSSLCQSKNSKTALARSTESQRARSHLYRQWIAQNPTTAASIIIIGPRRYPKRKATTKIWIFSTLALIAKRRCRCTRISSTSLWHRKDRKWHTLLRGIHMRLSLRSNRRPHCQCCQVFRRCYSTDRRVSLQQLRSPLVCCSHFPRRRWWSWSSK